MAKLSEIKGTSLVKVLTYGSPGVGKTCFAAGFPLPILYFDFDNKVSSAARFFSKDQERLSQIEVKSLGSSLNKDPMTEFLAEIESLRKMEASGTIPYKTLVIDSLTTFSSAVLNHIIKTNPGIKGVITAQGVSPAMPHYGILLREFTRLIPSLLTLNMNIVMLGHLAVYKNEATGEMIKEVMMDGSFSEKAPIFFDEVYYAFKDDKGRFMAQTQSGNGFKCRSQIQGLPNPVELSYEAIAKFLK